MARLLIALLAVLALTAFAPAPFPRREARRDRQSVEVSLLLGGWNAVRLITTGSNQPERDPRSNGVAHVTITPTQWIFNKQDRTPTTYDLRIDHTKKPATIDFINRGQTTPYGTGIIRREGNKLRIIYTWSHNRATSFDNPPASHWDLTLQRE